MMLKPNAVKSGLANRQVQLGLWCALSNSLTTEILAGSGYDWLTLDMEHSPNDLQTVLSQIQMLGGYDVEAAVRLIKFDKDLVKQYLDLGVRTLIFPSIESAAVAREIVSAARYPSRGIRGVAGQQRANRWGRVTDYHKNAEQNICILAQIESAAGVANVKAIVEVDGIDGVFVGPNDLAASMGYLGKPGTPEVQQAIEQVARIVRDAGKGTGILAASEADAVRFIDWGYTMVGLGSDQSLLAKASDALVTNVRKALGEK